MEAFVQHKDGLWARAGSLLTAGWLIVSAFAWEQGPSRTGAVVIGYLVFVFALLETRFDELRGIESALGGALVALAWALPGASVVMRLETTALGAVVILLSLVSRQGAIGPALHRPESGSGAG